MSHYESGDYTARITRQGFSESKQKSTPFFFIEFDVIAAAGPNALPEKCYRRTIDMYCTEKTKDFVIEKLRRLGWNGTKLVELEPGSPNHHSFVGQEIQVYNKPDGDYDDFELAQEDAPKSGGTEALPGIASKLDKLFGKSLMASVPVKKAAPKKETVPPAGKEEDDDSCPF